MASSLFSSSNPFRRKAEEEDRAAADPEPSAAAAAFEVPTRKRKTETELLPKKKPKSTKSRKRKGDEKEQDEESLENRSEQEEEEADDDEVEEYDSEEKMQRTIFVGNLALATKKKALVREFSRFGAVESARLRSVPVGTTKIPRRGAVITGQLSDKRSSLNGYVVFKDVESAKAALEHNMKEFGGKHIRVDIAQPRSQMSKNGVVYDKTRSIFVGNLPMDVEDEELHSLFSDGSSEAVLEAVRVVRDQKTNIGKGIAFVLFKSKDGVKHTFGRGPLELRKRTLRLRRVTTSTSGAEQQSKAAPRKANPRRNRRPIPDSKVKAKSYEGSRSTDKKQGRSGFTRTLKNNNKVEKTGRNKKRPAVAAKKARQKGLQVPSSTKKNNNNKKKKPKSKQ